MKSPGRTLSGYRIETHFCHLLKHFMRIIPQKRDLQHMFLYKNHQNYVKQPFSKLFDVKNRILVSYFIYLIYTINLPKHL